MGTNAARDVLELFAFKYVILDTVPGFYIVSQLA